MEAAEIADKASLSYFKVSVKSEEFMVKTLRVAYQASDRRNVLLEDERVIHTK